MLLVLEMIAVKAWKAAQCRAHDKPATDASVWTFSAMTMPT